MTQADDSELLAAAQAGEEAALLALLERYQDSVYRFGRRMCGNDDAAKDVLQETLMVAMEKLHTFRAESSFSSWLYAIARSRCSHQYRKRRRESGEPPSDAVADESPRPDELATRQHLRKTLERAVASLEPTYREVILLRDVEGLSAQEVADSLEITVPAVKSRLHRARTLLRELVERIVLEGEEGAGQAQRCPDVVSLLAQQMKEDLTPGRCADMEARLAKCSDMRGDLDGLRVLLRECRECQTAQPPEELRLAVREEIRQALARRPAGAVPLALRPESV